MDRRSSPAGKRALRALAGAVLVLGCSRAPVSSARTAVPSSGTAGQTEDQSESGSTNLRRKDVPTLEMDVLPEVAWRETVVGEEALTVALPDGARWVSSRPAAGGWSQLQHPPSGSSLWLRHRVARRSVKVEECEKQARSSLRLLRESWALAWQQPLAAPSDYLGHLSVSTAAGAGGIVVAMGAGVSRCYSAVFSSSPAPGWPRRLEVGSRILASIKLIGLDQRASPRPIDPL